MKKVLFITNIPVPYRVDFYNKLGNKMDVTVMFEATGASDQEIRLNYNLDEICNFKAVFLSNGNIREKRVDRKIFKHLTSLSYDCIVVTSYSYFTEMAALLYLKFRKIPYYLSSDGGLIKHNENSLKRIYKKFLITGAKGYFSPSQKADEYLMYYGAKSEWIHRYPFTSLKERDGLKNPIPFEEKRKYKALLNIKESIMILGVGRFIHRKGWDVLLKAAKGLPGNIGIYIVGGSAIDEYLELKESLRLERVYFIDFKSKDELTKYYMAADIFVLPTREDIWGLVINEAMSFALPVITTDSCLSGLELVVENKNGFIIHKIDSKSAIHELTGEMVKLCQDDELRGQFAINSLTTIKEYSIEKMVESYYCTLNEE